MSLFFFERTWPAASMRPACLIYLSTSNRNKREASRHQRNIQNANIADTLFDLLHRSPTDWTVDTYLVLLHNVDYSSTSGSSYKAECAHGRSYGHLEVQVQDYSAALPHMAAINSFRRWLNSQGTLDAPVKPKACRFLLLPIKRSSSLCEVFLSFLLRNTTPWWPLVPNSETLHFLFRRQRRHTMFVEQ